MVRARTWNWLLAIVLLFAASGAAQARSRVGLALSGGGAKGFAHIGVIMVLEENGIPVDYIAGTSMGSIVGALYAIGYSIEEIEQIALETDWPDLFSDRIHRRSRAIEQKPLEDRYLMALPLINGRIGLPRGLIAGQKISTLFNRLTLPVHDEHDFESFPIPFRCVATDIATGEAVVLNSGYLPEALRASMAIPSAFTPVDIDGRLLVDGMLVRNFPVEDVIEMGADIVIGVDVGAPLAGREELQSFLSILGQAIGFLGAASTNRQRELCDILVTPDISDVSATDFTRMEDIIAGGRAAAETVLPQLRELAARLDTSNDPPRPELDVQPDSMVLVEISLENLEHVEPKVIEAVFAMEPGSTVTVNEIENAVTRAYETGFFERVTYRVESAPGGKKLSVNTVEKTGDFFRFGLRFDSKDQMSAIFNLLYRNRFGRSSLFSFDIILGERTEFLGRYSIHPALRQRLVLHLRFSYLDDFIDLYRDGDQIARLDLSAAFTEFMIGSAFSNRLAMGVGVRGELADIKSDVSNIDLANVEEEFFFPGGRRLVRFIGPHAFSDPRHLVLYPAREFRESLGQRYQLYTPLL